LLGVLSLGVSRGDTITIIADGEDQDEAVANLVALINGNFDE
jgi:phosphocarrier protein